MWHCVLPLRGSIHGKKIAIKEARRCFGGSVREKGRSKFVGRQLQSDLFEKKFTFERFSRHHATRVAEAVITHSDTPPSFFVPYSEGILFFYNYSSQLADGKPFELYNTSISSKSKISAWKSEQQRSKSIVSCINVRF